jgi:hypothetical protein
MIKLAAIRGVGAAIVPTSLPWKGLSEDVNDYFWMEH